MSDWMTDEQKARWDAHQAEHASAVRALGDRIGYGALMHFAEQEWSAKLAREGLPPGGAHSRGCCVAFLVPCPGCEARTEQNPHCDWCCGAGRVTQRVAQAINAAGRRLVVDGVELVDGDRVPLGVTDSDYDVSSGSWSKR